MQVKKIREFLFFTKKNRFSRVFSTQPAFGRGAWANPYSLKYNIPFQGIVPASATSDIEGNDFIHCHKTTTTNNFLIPEYLLKHAAYILMVKGKKTINILLWSEHHVKVIFPSLCPNYTQLWTHVNKLFLLACSLAHVVHM